MRVGVPIIWKGHIYCQWLMWPFQRIVIQRCQYNFFPRVNALIFLLIANNAFLVFAVYRAQTWILLKLKSVKNLKQRMTVDTKYKSDSQQSYQLSQFFVPDTGIDCIACCHYIKYSTISISHWAVSISKPMLAEPGAPKQSPIQVLSWPNVPQLQFLNGNWDDCFYYLLKVS